MNRKNIYYIAVLVFIASIFAFFLFYKTITGKEKRIDSEISGRINKLKSVQKNIAENINGIKKIEIPVLRYGYSFNENDNYFISEIVGASKKYSVKLNYVKLINSKKDKNAARYLFKVSGYGKPANIYLFVKTLEYNYKIELKKFFISKKSTKGARASFSSILSVYVIKKSAVLPHYIAKSKNSLNPPDNLGIINPFNNASGTKKAFRKVRIKPQKKVFAIRKEQKTAVAVNVYKKLSNKYKIKGSDFYNKKGVLFFKRNDLGKALAMFKKSIMLNPNNYQALSNAALDNYETGNYNESIFYAKKALNQKKLWQINFILGLDYLHNKNFSKAEYYFEQSSKLNPLNDKIKYYLNIAKNRR
ncbi:MAG: tetratricopeptide repeat protein [bacterium]